MSTYLKFCSCRSCRAGMRIRQGKHYVRCIARKARRECRQAIKQGKEPRQVVSVGYTD